ncbi:MAG: hypothetical protein U1A28_05235 [Patescibacteria group bacterium]|nr:hypothetical protein [Patescibacteria group bacterium]
MEKENAMPEITAFVVTGGPGGGKAAERFSADTGTTKDLKTKALERARVFSMAARHEAASQSAEMMRIQKQCLEERDFCRLRQTPEATKSHRCQIRFRTLTRQPDSGQVAHNTMLPPLNPSRIVVHSGEGPVTLH